MQPTKDNIDTAKDLVKSIKYLNNYKNKIRTHFEKQHDISQEEYDNLLTKAEVDLHIRKDLFRIMKETYNLDDTGDVKEFTAIKDNVSKETNTKFIIMAAFALLGIAIIFSISGSFFTALFLGTFIGLFAGASFSVKLEDWGVLPKDV